MTNRILSTIAAICASACAENQVVVLTATFGADDGISADVDTNDGTEETDSSPPLGICATEDLQNATLIYEGPCPDGTVLVCEWQDAVGLEDAVTGCCDEATGECTFESALSDCVDAIWTCQIPIEPTPVVCSYYTAGGDDHYALLAGECEFPYDIEICRPEEHVDEGYVTICCESNIPPAGCRAVHPPTGVIPVDCEDAMINGYNYQACRYMP